MTCINDYFHDHLYFYLDSSSDDSTNAPSESKRINSHKPDVNPIELHIFLLLSLLSKKLSKEIPWTDSELPFPQTDPACRAAQASSSGSPSGGTGSRTCASGWVPSSPHVEFSFHVTERVLFIEYSLIQQIFTYSGIEKTLSSIYIHMMLLYVWVCIFSFFSVNVRMRKD